MKKPLASSLLASLCLAFAACGGADSHAVGTYELDITPMVDQIEQNMPAEMKDNAEAQGMLAKMKEQMKGSIELTADHVAKVHVEMPMSTPIDDTGTWKLEGEKITFTGGKDGESKDGTLKDGVITITEEKDGQKMTMVFRKK